MYPYGLIGNCQVSALISHKGSIDWLCLPRPDSPPVFGKLLDPGGGFFSIDTIGNYKTQQHYITNTNILVTHFQGEDGSEFSVTDFSPRFDENGKLNRPPSIIRVIELIRGNPRIRLQIHTINGWGKELILPHFNSGGLHFETGRGCFHVESNVPAEDLIEHKEIALDHPLYFALSWNLTFQFPLASVIPELQKKTKQYWQTWVQHCTIPYEYQKETIRSALTLKLHCYEDTGAILAALTTSLPEEEGRNRNWDYRYCWLRDSYFVLSAFHNLGHFEEMEGFLKYLLSLINQHEHSRDRLWPVYTLDQALPLPEKEHLNWNGFKNSRPVRSNNQAAEHVQNDVYGEMILTLAPIFFDERFQHLRTRDHEELLQNLAHSCVRSIGQSDAGLWELRNGWQEHSFSNLMCWAGIERISRIRKSGFLKSLDLNLKSAQDQAETALRRAVIDGSLRNGPKDPTLDSALLQLPILRFPDYAVCRETTLKIARDLRLAETPESRHFLYRYSRHDDFGAPQSSFLVCSFWLAQALARIGENRHAQEVMESAVSSANSLGLYAEHYSSKARGQCGNFPQAYSHVGQINAAFALSPSWAEIL